MPGEATNAAAGRGYLLTRRSGEATLRGGDKLSSEGIRWHPGSDSESPIDVVYDPARERGDYVSTDLPVRYDAFVCVDETEALHPLHGGSFERHSAGLPPGVRRRSIPSARIVLRSLTSQFIHEYQLVTSVLLHW